MKSGIYASYCVSFCEVLLDGFWFLIISYARNVMVLS